MAYPTNWDCKRECSTIWLPKLRHYTVTLSLCHHKDTPKVYPFWTQMGTPKKRVTLHSLAINMYAEISAMLLYLLAGYGRIIKLISISNLACNSPSPHYSAFFTPAQLISLDFATLLLTVTPFLIHSIVLRIPLSS